jgi:hypothetical protein
VSIGIPLGRREEAIVAADGGLGNGFLVPFDPGLFVKISAVLQDTANPHPDTPRASMLKTPMGPRPSTDPSRFRRGTMSHLTFLELLARHDARLWEAIHPHVPILRGVAERGAEVSLNPQPIPPKVLGALAARELLQLAWQARMLGIDPARISDAGDILCPLPPKLPKFPWRWPSPPPDPDPDWYKDFHIGVIDEIVASPMLSERSSITKPLASKVQESSAFIGKSVGKAIG